MHRLRTDIIISQQLFIYMKTRLNLYLWCKEQKLEVFYSSCRIYQYQGDDYLFLPSLQTAETHKHVNINRFSLFTYSETLNKEYIGRIYQMSS